MGQDRISVVAPPPIHSCSLSLDPVSFSSVTGNTESNMDTSNVTTTKSSPSSSSTRRRKQQPSLRPPVQKPDNPALLLLSSGSSSSTSSHSSASSTASKSHGNNTPLSSPITASSPNKVEYFDLEFDESIAKYNTTNGTESHRNHGESLIESGSAHGIVRVRVEHTPSDMTERTEFTILSTSSRSTNRRRLENTSRLARGGVQSSPTLQPPSNKSPRRMQHPTTFDHRPRFPGRAESVPEFNIEDDDTDNSDQDEKRKGNDNKDRDRDDLAPKIPYRAKTKDVLSSSEIQIDDDDDEDEADKDNHHHHHQEYHPQTQNRNGRKSTLPSPSSPPKRKDKLFKRHKKNKNRHGKNHTPTGSTTHSSSLSSAPKKIWDFFKSMDHTSPYRQHNKTSIRATARVVDRSPSVPGRKASGGENTLFTCSKLTMSDNSPKLPSRSKSNEQKKLQNQQQLPLKLPLTDPSNHDDDDDDESDEASIGHNHLPLTTTTTTRFGGALNLGDSQSRFEAENLGGSRPSLADASLKMPWRKQSCNTLSVIESSGSFNTNDRKSSGDKPKHNCREYSTGDITKATTTLTDNDSSGNNANTIIIKSSIRHKDRRTLMMKSSLQDSKNAKMPWRRQSNKKLRVYDDNDSNDSINHDNGSIPTNTNKGALLNEIKNSFRNLTSTVSEAVANLNIDGSEKSCRSARSSRYCSNNNNVNVDNSEKSCKSTRSARPGLVGGSLRADNKHACPNNSVGGRKTVTFAANENFSRRTVQSMPSGREEHRPSLKQMRNNMQSEPCLSQREVVKKSRRGALTALKNKANLVKQAVVNRLSTTTSSTTDKAPRQPNEVDVLH